MDFDWLHMLLTFALGLTLYRVWFWKYQAKCWSEACRTWQARYERKHDFSRN